MANKVYQNNIFAPTKHYGSYTNTLRNGRWNGYYSNDKLWYVGNYVNGDLNGLFVEYTSEEKLEKISFYIR
jgi:antitoxin component YwqK of YwqJK toxin-antitoxin module